MSAPNRSFASTPEPPYYSVIFTSQRSNEDGQGYDQMATRMVELAAQQPGFLGIETVRGADGFGITVSYWTSLESISAWKRETEHQAAQNAGRNLWYSDYQLRVGQVLRAYAKP